MALRTITIEVIPHEDQNYETIGDYSIDADGIHIRVSDMGNIAAEAGVALHEFIELVLCQLAGTPFESIDAFDLKFEEETKQGLHALTDEPGDDPAAPYYAQHQFASVLERLFVQQAGLDWKAYDDLMMKIWRKEYPQKSLDLN